MVQRTVKNVRWVWHFEIDAPCCLRTLLGSGVVASDLLDDHLRQAGGAGGRTGWRSTWKRARGAVAQTPLSRRCREIEGLASAQPWAGGCVSACIEFRPVFGSRIRGFLATEVPTLLILGGSTLACVFGMEWN